MGETSESEHTEKMQSNERETGEQTQNEQMSIIPSQAAAKTTVPEDDLNGQPQDENPGMTQV
jgi:hypothetical protein